MIMIVNLYYI